MTSLGSSATDAVLPTIPSVVSVPPDSPSLAPEAPPSLAHPPLVSVINGPNFTSVAPVVPARVIPPSIVIDVHPPPVSITPGTSASEAEPLPSPPPSAAPAIPVHSKPRQNAPVHHSSAAGRHSKVQEIAELQARINSLTTDLKTLQVENVPRAPKKRSSDVNEFNVCCPWL